MEEQKNRQTDRLTDLEMEFMDGIRGILRSMIHSADETTQIPFTRTADNDFLDDFKKAIDCFNVVIQMARDKK